MADSKVTKIIEMIDMSKYIKIAVIGDGPVALTLTAYLSYFIITYKLPIKIKMYRGNYGHIRNHVVSLSSSLLKEIERILFCTKCLVPTNNPEEHDKFLIQIKCIERGIFEQIQKYGFISFEEE